jgi:uncharacterized repeat protein (TIGR04076 family)
MVGMHQIIPHPTFPFCELFGPAPRPGHQSCTLATMDQDGAELYDLRLAVVEIRGRSVCGLRVGDHIDLVESSRLVLPEGRHFCLYALAAALPLLPAKQRRLDPGDWLEGDSLVSCPDPEEGVVMRIERLRPRRIRRQEVT